MIKKQIPNILTLGNLFSGCCAILLITANKYDKVSYCILISLIADYLDGTVARLLHVQSDMGKELDSLADMVSFGVVPAFMAYTLLYGNMSTFGLSIEALPAFLIACFSGYRLAKFNLDTRQTENFIGLATPANTIFWWGLMLSCCEGLNLPTTGLYAVIAVSCYLLVAEIPMFSFKFKSFAWRDNAMRYTFALCAISLLVVWQNYLALSIVVVLYVLFSIVAMIFNKNKA